MAMKTTPKHGITLLLAATLTTLSWSFSPSCNKYLRPGVHEIQRKTFTITSKCNDFSEGFHHGETDESVKGHLLSRRKSITQSVLAAGAILTTASSPSKAEISDDTDTYSNTSPDSSYSSLTRRTPATTTAPTDTTDEFTITIPKSSIAQSGGLGIELGDIEFRTNRRIYVKSLKPNSLAEKLGVRKDYVIVSINGQGAERTTAQGVSLMVQRVLGDDAVDALQIRFRDPGAFREQVAALEPGQSATTQLAPGGDTTRRNPDGSIKFGEKERSQSDQKLTVTQLVPPKLCRKPVEVDDLLEISYLGTVLDTGKLFDGSAISLNDKGIPGRGGDVTIFFVFGKQPMGQFPPGWDVGLYGMCIGETRRLIIPPTLAYGDVGAPKRGIPPNATLQYDVTLISINGLALPQ